MPDKKKCFVIMPFGYKKDINGQEIKFDTIYRRIIKAAVEDAKLECVRCDEIDEAGWIHAKMFKHVYDSDVAVVDITSLNPNVFYELGVRHALAKCVTVLIRRKGTEIPFNIRGFNVIDYDHEDLDSAAEAKEKIAAFIRNGLRSNQSDSPVHEVLQLKIGVEPQPIGRTQIYPYRLREVNDKQICLITGDLQDVKDIDIWVNSENTNMQMARHFDQSISGVIRYMGAEKDPAGNVTDDIIAKELAKIAGENANVPQGSVIPTGSGELERSNGVKRIFHAAAVSGQVGQGYRPIGEIGRCVRNALELAESKAPELKSILFPLLGTGTSRGDLEGKARELIKRAVSYLESNPKCKIQEVYFLAWREHELDACQRILQAIPEVAFVRRAGKR